VDWGEDSEQQQQQHERFARRRDVTLPDLTTEPLAASNVTEEHAEEKKESGSDRFRGTYPSFLAT